MSDFRPGDKILFRDRGSFGLARVDLVRDRHLTCFPFDHARRRWARRNMRIAHHLVVERIEGAIDPARLARDIEALRNQRDAKRAAADAWLADQVEQLLQEAKR